MLRTLKSELEMVPPALSSTTHKPYFFHSQTTPTANPGTNSTNVGLLVVGTFLLMMTPAAPLGLVAISAVCIEAMVKDQCSPTPKNQQYPADFDHPAFDYGDFLVNPTDYASPPSNNSASLTLKMLLLLCSVALITSAFLVPPAAGIIVPFLIGVGSIGFLTSSYDIALEVFSPEKASNVETLARPVATLS